MIISEIFVMKINITGLDRHFQMCKKDLGYSGNKIVTNKKKKKIDKRAQQGNTFVT